MICNAPRGNVIFSGSISAMVILLLLENKPALSQELIVITPDLQLEKITENAYVHISWSDSKEFGRYSSNGLILTDGEKAFLFDTPPDDTLTKHLYNYLNDIMGFHVEGFIPNHWHEDCMGGLGYIKNRGISSYANIKTIEIAKTKNLPVPDTGFRDSLKLRFGTKVIECFFPGPAHSLDNIVIWIPSEHILFAGCMCKSIDSDNPGNTADGDISEYPASINKVIRRYGEAEIVIPGHGRHGGIELLIHTRSLFE